jgi:hypothetical protein
MSVTLNGTSGLVFSDGTIQGTAGYVPFRNKIINGAMGIWQRGTTFQPNAVVFGADRFASYKEGASAGDYARSTDVPAGQGFTYSAYFNGADIRHSIELPGAAQRGEFEVGTTWTLSFWCKATGSGTGSANVGWANGVSASSLSNWGSNVSFTYNTTWQKRELTFTVSGTPSGSQPAVLVYISAITGLLITGVQFEKGSATAFEFRPIGTELAMCQRYYQKSGATVWSPGISTNSGVDFRTSQRFVSTTDRASVNIPFLVSMRTSPTVTFYPARAAVANTANRLTVYNGDTLVTFTSGGVGMYANGINGHFQTLSTSAEMYTLQFVAEAEL